MQISHGSLYGGCHVLCVVSCQPAAPLTSRRQWKGRLHICSKSLFFDPDDNRNAILRFSFDKLAAIAQKQHRDTKTSPVVEYISLLTRELCEVQSNAPYTFTKLDPGRPQAEYMVTLQYSEMAKLLPFIHKLHDITVNTPFRQKDEALARVIRQHEDAIQFDSSSIADIREKVQLPGGRAIVCSQVTPLVTIPGALQLTDQRLYFQSFNNVSSEIVSKWDIADIKRLYRRRYIMSDKGIEFFYPIKGASAAVSKPTAVAGSRWGGGRAGGGAASASSSSPASSSSASSSVLSQQSAFFTFANRVQRDSIFDLIQRQPSFKPSREASLEYMTGQWVKGSLSNYDYLMFLNQQGGRSFQDLTQYPVFPWILADHTSRSIDLRDERVYRDLSKPIGALNPTRLETFRRRMREMPKEMGAPFLYGTHYSSPGYVLYYLVRRAPQYQLKLQNGRFDQPDRLFVSVGASWDSVLNGPADVKELIPEFYTTELTASSSSKVGDFLVNELGLDMGVRQNGREVDDVELPAWAKTPKEYVAKMRQALESEYVSAHLHEWVDLIFGYKQTGDEAVNADNLFYYLTYEGAVDLDAITDPVERRSLESQINEFGQTPKKIFDRPHPQRQPKTKSSNGADSDDDDDSDEEDEQEEEASDKASIGRKQSLRGARSPSIVDGNNPFATSASSTPTSSAAGSNPFASPTASTASLPVASASSTDNNPFGTDSPTAASNVSGSAGKKWTWGQKPAAATAANTAAREELKDVTAASAVVGAAAAPSSTVSASAASAATTGIARLQASTSVPVKPVIPSYMNDTGASHSSSSIDAGAANPVSPTSSGSVITSAASSALPTNIAQSDYDFQLPAPSWQSTWPASSSYARSHLLSQHRDAVTALAFSADSAALLSLSSDSHLKLYSLADNRLYRSCKVGDLTLSAFAALPAASSASRVLALASWDNRIYLYSINGSSILSSFEAHDDAVSALIALPSAAATPSLLSASWDASLKLWPVRESTVASTPLLSLHEHDTPVKALAVDEDGRSAVSGSEDGCVIVWDLRAGSKVRVIEETTEEISSLLCLAGGDILVASKESELRRYDRGGGVVCSYACEEDVYALASEGGGGQQVLMGGDSGVLRWLSLSDGSIKQLSRLEPHQGPIRSLSVSADGKRLACGTGRAKDNVGIWNVKS